MLKDFNLLEIFWDYDIITIDMPSLGFYPALGLYSAGQSTGVLRFMLRFFSDDFSTTTSVLKA